MGKPMTSAADFSGIKVVCARVSNLRALQNVEVSLDNLTVLVGPNNAGKTSFLDAIYAAIGGGRRAPTPDDISLLPGEAFAPKERALTVDIKVRPCDSGNGILPSFPTGSFWTELWGAGIAVDIDHEFMAFRMTYSWKASRGEYVLERKFLKEWLDFPNWLNGEQTDERVRQLHLEPLAMHFVDAQRDLDDDLRRPGSFWRRLTDDLGLGGAEIDAIEENLSDINDRIVSHSTVLQHLKNSLLQIAAVVATDASGVSIAPIARTLRDLSKGIDVSITTPGAQTFSLSRHGMGTRSLASLVVFRSFADWNAQQAAAAGATVHSILALEEPEAHLHPQAQRALFAQVREIRGQRLVSTHSPYFAGQAALSDLRFFSKSGGLTRVSSLDLSEIDDVSVRKLERNIVNSRGDLLFASAWVLAEGETEQYSMPVWAEEYWGRSVHEIGVSFVGIGGGDYFPYIWLAQRLNIPWFIFSDGEPSPVATLEKALKAANCSPSGSCKNVKVLPGGNDFEKQLLDDGYLTEVIAALEATEGEGFFDSYVKSQHGQMRKGKTVRDYSGQDGPWLAALDAIRERKTHICRPIAEALISLADGDRRVPSALRELFDEMVSSLPTLWKKAK